tara:strand:+ start:5898 stop:7508 length:1611 start_codon:yes stop_codon:yes gene_type:complete
MTDIIISNGQIIDGTGKPKFNADILISGSNIDYIGDTSDINADIELNAKGKIVCPGFIDIHTHADFPIFVDGLSQSSLRQGITTLVTGNCGHGPAPSPINEITKRNVIGFNEEWGIDIEWNTFEEYLEKLFTKGISTNIAPLVPHGTIRLAAMGSAEREPTQKELNHMESLIAEAMSAGAIGISTGLEYSPGQYANQKELISLTKVVEKYGGIYASHIRERGDNFEQSVKEALNIIKHSGVPGELSHLVPRPYAPKKSFEKVLSLINKARTEGLHIGIDTFPDIWGPAHLVDLLPRWICDGSEEAIIERLSNPKTATLCKKYFKNPTNYLLRTGSFDFFFLSHSNSYPELIGKSLKEISILLKLHPIETILKLAAADGKDFANVLIRHIYANQDDLEKLLLDPYCSIESDGAIGSTSGILKNLVMNRSSYGFAPRFLREYVIEKEMFTIEEGIRKLTSLPAKSASLKNIGKIEKNMAADIVILDQQKLRDNTTDNLPQVYPDGIDMVIVNGKIVIKNETHTKKMPGKLIKSALRKM